MLITSENNKEMTALVSHELKNPLNTIIGFSDLIIEENSISDIKLFAGIIKKHGSSLLEKIKKIDSLSQECDRRELRFSVLDLDKIFNDSLFRVKRELDICESTIYIDKSANLSELKIMTDVCKYEKIIYSLLKSVIVLFPGSKIFIKTYLINNSNKRELVVQISNIENASNEDLSVKLNCDYEINIKNNFSLFNQAGVDLAFCKLLSKQIYGKIYFDYSSNYSKTYFSIPVDTVGCNDKVENDIPYVLIIDNFISDVEYISYKNLLSKYSFPIIRASLDAVESIIKDETNVKIVIIQSTKCDEVTQKLIYLKELYRDIIFICIYDHNDNNNITYVTKSNFQILNRPVTRDSIECLIDMFVEKRINYRFKNWRT